MGICWSLCDDFDLVNASLLLRFYFSPLNSTGKFNFTERLLQNFVIYFFILIKNALLSPGMFPLMKNSFLQKSIFSLV